MIADCLLSLVESCVCICVVVTAVAWGKRRLRAYHVVETVSTSLWQETQERVWCRLSKWW